MAQGEHRHDQVLAEETRRNYHTVVAARSIFAVAIAGRPKKSCTTSTGLLRDPVERGVSRGLSREGRRPARMRSSVRS